MGPLRVKILERKTHTGRTGMGIGLLKTDSVRAPYSEPLPISLLKAPDSVDRGRLTRFARDTERARSLISTGHKPGYCRIRHHDGGCHTKEPVSLSALRDKMAGPGPKDKFFHLPLFLCRCFLPQVCGGGCSGWAAWPGGFLEGRCLPGASGDEGKGKVNESHFPDALEDLPM